MPLLQHLKEHPFTQGLPEPVLKKLVAIAREVQFEQDEVVFHAGEQSKYFCLILNGSVCVEISTPVYGVHIQTLGPGEVFGWSSLLEEHYTVFQVRARETSRALCFDGHLLAQACERDPKLCAGIFRRIAAIAAKRVKATELRLAEFCGAANHDHERQPPGRNLPPR